MANNNNIYPLAIIRDRYSGSYSGGTYVAFNLEASKVPAEVFGDDCTAMRFGNILKECSDVEEVLTVQLKIF